MLKKNRQIAILISIVLACIIAGLLLIEIVLPKYSSKIDSVFAAKAAADIEYSVHLIENPIYDQDILPSGGYYLKPFTDFISITCDLSVESDEDIDVQAEDSIDVVLVSQLGNADEINVIWEKKQVYARPQLTISEKGLLKSQRKMKLYFSSFDELVDELVEDYDLITDYFIKVTYNCAIQVTNSDDIQEEFLTTELIIPFNNPIYNIEGENSATKDIAYELETKERQPINVNLIILYGIALLIVIGFILLLLFKTNYIEKEDEYSIQVSNIFKEYGNRLAGLSEAMSYQSSVMISINRIEDMVKIADEIGQTVFYYTIEVENERKTEFYVFDEGRIYYLVMFGNL